MIYLTMLIWNLFIWSGTAYLVFWKGHSGVWFILTILMTGTIKDKCNTPKPK
jgi:hypothetical protein